MTTPLVPFVSSTMIGTTIPFVVTNDNMESQKGGMGIDRQLSVEQRPRKRRKSHVLEEIDETSRLNPTRLTMPTSSGSIPLPTSQVVLSQGSLVVSQNSHDGGKSNSSLTPSSSMPFVPSPSYYQTIPTAKGGHRVIFSEQTASYIEQARFYSKQATSLEATAVKHSQFIWSQEDSRVSSDYEVNLVSTAAAASVVASVAKVVAAVEKVAHEDGFQAKLMAIEALNSANALHGIHSGATEGGNEGHQRKAIHKLS